jgi:hypothetical protein
MFVFITVRLEGQTITAPPGTFWHIPFCTDTSFLDAACQFYVEQDLY